MPCTMVDVAPAESFGDAISKFSDIPNVFIVFLADKDPSTGNSWCPDCREAEPIIEQCFTENAEKYLTLVRCYVGDKPTWRNPSHPFRIDPILKLTCVPTLGKWEGHALIGCLVEEEACERSLINALIG